MADDGEVATSSPFTLARDKVSVAAAHLLARVARRFAAVCDEINRVARPALGCERGGRPPRRERTAIATVTLHLPRSVGLARLHVICNGLLFAFRISRSSLLARCTVVAQPVTLSRPPHTCPSSHQHHIHDTTTRYPSAVGTCLRSATDLFASRDAINTNRVYSISIKP